MMNVVLDYRAEPLNLALAGGNSQNTAFVPLAPSNLSPDPNRSKDGFVIFSGTEGQVSPGRLILIPYAEGQGAMFSMRLYAWRRLGTDSRLWVWVPMLLAEFACITSNQAGPTDAQPGSSTRLIKDTEFLCDTISLTQGSLGNCGLVTSTGPGTNLIAFAIVDGCGATLISFDFQQTDPVGMNCLWARA